MTRNLSFFYGIGLILIGIILLVPQIFGFSWGADELSFISLSVIGFFMIISYFISQKKPFGLVLFGTLLLFLGLLFFYSLHYGWGVWKYIAPSPIFILAVSFLLTYLVDKRHPYGFFVAAIVLGIVSLSIFIILSMIFNETTFTSIALIISGLLLPLTSLTRKKRLQKPFEKDAEPAKSSTAKVRNVKK